MGMKCRKLFSENNTKMYNQQYKQYHSSPYEKGAPPMEAKTHFVDGSKN